MSALQGRVFDRFRQFEKLSPELKSQVAAVAQGVVQSRPFASHNLSLLSTVAGIKGDKLVEFIQQQLKEPAVSSEQAAQIVDGLVLHGSLALHDEDKAENVTKLEGFSDAKTVFVPTDVDTSVWGVRDGAIQAGAVKRAAKGILGGKAVKDSYAVANDKLKGLFLFDSDHALHLRDKVDLTASTVEFDATIQHGIKVSNATTSVVVGVSSKDKQDEWLNSIINAGAVYREAFNVDIESVKSFYELKDFDMSGKEVSMADYEGKVVLVVNVSSNCGLTPTNYPELTALDEKYRDQGLAILAFPCNQFANQEPGTHEEIIEFVKKYNCQFPFFEKHDVNGKDARPVFTYLKAKLPGSFGNFVKWNFTKFLVDRNGQPYKRFAPKDLPFSFEEDIKTLLAQAPSNL